MTQSITIKDNVDSRKAAEEAFDLTSLALEDVFDLISQTLNVDELSSEAKRKAWVGLGAMIDSVTRIERESAKQASLAIQPRPRRDPDAMPEWQVKTFEVQKCPFRKYGHLNYEDVPLSFLRWIVDKNKDLEAYVIYRENHDQDEI